MCREGHAQAFLQQPESQSRRGGLGPAGLGVPSYT